MRLECEPAPLLIAFVLGLIMEDNLRRALLISGGEWSTFVERPLCLALLCAAALLLALLLLPAIRRRRDDVLAGESQ
jgi:putative tricarboxylic transport membrane protein